MSRVVADRLWPVLLALVLLLTGALTLEIVASGREADPVVVVIDEASAVMVSDDEGEGSDTGAPDAETPVDQDHARARLAARRGELTEALSLFEAVASAHPETGRVHAERGYWLLAADREREALEALARAAALHPDSAWVALNLGLAHGRLRDEAAAEREYRRALARRPDYGAAQIALGNLLRKRNAVDEAITVLERAAAHGSNDERARALVALGHAYLTARRHDDAARAFERAIERAPAAAEIRVGVARGYLAAGSEADVARAIEVLERAVTLAPDVPHVQVALARALEKRGDVHAAEAAYERAIRLDPTYRYARIRMFRLALGAQDFPRARMQVQYMLQHEPDEPEHHFRAGLVAAREGRPDEARGHYLAAIDKAGGKYPEAYFNLGSVERDLDHPDDAIAARLSPRPSPLLYRTFARLTPAMLIPLQHTRSPALSMIAPHDLSSVPVRTASSTSNTLSNRALESVPYPEPSEALS
jgi:tetratricopeptide (TPR) repeat protein